jgi:hypothetical protein
MAQWNIEQKAIIWYRTTVEADTFEEAVVKAEEQDDWYYDRHNQEFTGEYWGENTETENQYTLTDGIVEEESNGN